jgi:prevent-host-death family protein
MKTKTTLSITEVRKNIFSIAEKIQKDDDYFTLTERGVPKVVMISAEKFESLTKKKDLVLADDPSKNHASGPPRVFAKTLIIRDDSRVIYLSEDDRDSKHQEESLIRAQLYVRLIEKYKYPLGLIEFGRYVKIGPKESKRYIEADVIINDEKGNVKVLFEIVPFVDYEENSDKIITDLFDLAKSLSWIKKPEWLVYFSRNCKGVKSKEKITAVDYSKFNTFAAWKKAGRPSKKEIPEFKEQVCNGNHCY